MANKIILSLFILVSIFSYSSRVWAQVEEAQKSGPSPRAQVELTSNLIEDGYTQTEGSWGLITDIAYRWPQFELGIRGNNVYFEGESTHISLRPHLSIIANFSEDSRFYIEYEHRQYFNDNTRNGSLASIGLDFSKYSISYGSIVNWQGFDISKSKWRFDYNYEWNDQLTSLFSLGYNIVDEANTPNYIDANGNIQYRQANLVYYAEAIILSQVVSLIENAQPFLFRVGLKAGF